MKKDVLARTNESLLRNRLLFLVTALFTLFIVGCESVPKENSESSIKELTIVYTADEHGWILPSETNGVSFSGASGLKEAWDELDEANGAASLLKLSGGDMWTGAAVSTCFNGRSTVEVMNEIGYHAAALGNHEFDFSIDTLKKRVDEMAFPLLSANILEKATNLIPSFVKPYLVQEIDGIRIGIIGLTTLSTPTTANPLIVDPYKFTAYEPAVRVAYADLKKENPDLVIILGHICESEMQSLVPVAKELNISAIGGGHCHSTVARISDGIVLMEGNAFLRNYISLSLSVNTETDEVEILELLTEANQGQSHDVAVTDITTYWSNELNKILGSVIGYAEHTIYAGSEEMKQGIVNAWLWKFEQADIAITNRGGIRQNIEAGNILTSTLYGVLSFDNDLVQLTVKGADLKTLYSRSVESLIFGGADVANGMLSNGQQIEDAKLYKLITTDYLYAVEEMERFDANPISLNTNYRDPFIEWITQLNTSEQDPLERYL